MLRQTVGNGDTTVSEQKVLQRLSGRSLGMTTRDLARSLKIRPIEVNQCLLNLQRDGQVSFRGTKWFAVHARGELGNNVSLGRTIPSAPSAPPSSRHARDGDLLNSAGSFSRGICNMHSTLNQRVVGSSPTGSTERPPKTRGFHFLRE